MNSKSKQKNTKEDKTMATVTKPSVFEVKVTNQNKKSVMDKINEVRLTKAFFDKCAQVSKQYSKDEFDKNE